MIVVPSGFDGAFFMELIEIVEKIETYYNGYS